MCTYPGKIYKRYRETMCEYVILKSYHFNRTAFKIKDRIIKSVRFIFVRLNTGPESLTHK